MKLFDFEISSSSDPWGDADTALATVYQGAASSRQEQHRSASASQPRELRTRDLVGFWVWRSSRARVDFDQITLLPNGTYTAKVDATLVNPSVRSFGASCTLPESGEWNVFTVKGQTKLRVCPTTGPARVYTVERTARNKVTIARRGEGTSMVRTSAVPPPSGRFITH